jgi:hypothetical protein
VRGWNELAAEVDDAISLGLALLVLLAAAGIAGALWYFYPGWLPWRWRPLSSPQRGTRRRRPWAWLRWPWRWRRRRPRKSTVEPVEPEPLSTVDADELPDLPAEAFRSLADRLAAEGRYAEAVRERLRAIVRELIDAGLIDNRPGWTVTELAGMAARARPPVRPPLDAATRIFSDIWYGQRPAGLPHDEQMRGHAEAVHAVLAAGMPAPAGTAAPAGTNPPADPRSPASPASGTPLVGSPR